MEGLKEGDQEMMIALLIATVAICYGGLLRIAHVEGHI